MALEIMTEIGDLMMFRGWSMSGPLFEEALIGPNDNDARTVPWRTSTARTGRRCSTTAARSSNRGIHRWKQSSAPVSASHTRDTFKLADPVKMRAPSLDHASP